MNDNDKNILLIEDDPKNIQAIAQILMFEGYQLTFAMNGDEGLKQIKEQAFDLIMIDNQIAGLDAFSIVKDMQLIGHNCDTPTIFLLDTYEENMIKALYDAGVVDYIRKPFIEQEILTRIKIHLEKNAQKVQECTIDPIAVKAQISTPDVPLSLPNSSMLHSQEEIVLTLCSIAEKRSNEKEIHVKRVAEFSYLLAMLMGFNDEEATLLKMAAPLHDIGNLAISDTILDKPEKLSMDEFEIVEQHTVLGHDMLKDNPNPILKLASIVALEHHEKYNGTGYPQGLKADNINIYARIVALADVFDSLSEDRVYGKAWSDAEIEKYLQDERGQQFDPTLIDLFFAHKERFFALRTASAI